MPITLTRGKSGKRLALAVLARGTDAAILRQVAGRVGVDRSHDSLRNKSRSERMNERPHRVHPSVTAAPRAARSQSDMHGHAPRVAQAPQRRNPRRE
jgi:hypothetical protein